MNKLNLQTSLFLYTAICSQIFVTHRFWKVYFYKECSLACCMNYFPTVSNIAPYTYWVCRTQIKPYTINNGQTNLPFFQWHKEEPQTQKKIIVSFHAITPYIMHSVRAKKERNTSYLVTPSSKTLRFGFIYLFFRSKKQLLMGCPQKFNSSNITPFFLLF